MRPVRERAIAGEILLTIYCCLRSSPVGLSNGEGGMGRISAFVLAYNEAEKIKAAIETVLWADEIVVVDFALSGVRELARCRARQTTFQADQRQESVFSATRTHPFLCFPASAPSWSCLRCVSHVLASRRPTALVYLFGPRQRQILRAASCSAVPRRRIVRVPKVLWAGLCQPAGGYRFATCARRRALGCGSASPAACIGGRICCFGRRRRRLKR